MSVTDTVNEEELHLKLRKLRMCLEENVLDVDGRTGTETNDSGHNGLFLVKASPAYEKNKKNGLPEEDEDEQCVEEGKMRQLLRKWSNQWMTYWFPQGVLSYLYCDTAISVNESLFEQIVSCATK